jgi:hypothetical protein
MFEGGMGAWFASLSHPMTSKFFIFHYGPICYTLRFFHM